MCDSLLRLSLEYIDDDEFMKWKLEILGIDFDLVVGRERKENLTTFGKNKEKWKTWQGEEAL